MNRCIPAMALALITVTAMLAQSAEGPLPAGLPARWWQQPAYAQKLGLSADQQSRMDDTFLQYRLKLADLNAALQKEEALLEPMVAADRPDEAKVRAQIDRIAQARAELGKSNAYLLLSLRLILSPDQWRNLREFARRPRPGRGGNRDGFQPVPRKVQ